jgi:hypothetical protein
MARCESRVLSSKVGIHTFRSLGVVCCAPASEPKFDALTTSVRAIVRLRFGIILSRYSLSNDSVIVRILAPSAMLSMMMFLISVFVVSVINTTFSADVTVMYVKMSSVVKSNAFVSLAPADLMRDCIS